MSAQGAEMTAPVLDARLSAAASYVRRGGVCADIGCDHGKLCAYLAASGTCKGVIACDVKAAPLERARQTLERAGVLHLAQLRLGDGLSVLTPGEADSIVIAGMSGVTICMILQAAPQFWQSGTRFVFVPATKHSVLRGFLAESGFEILEETPCVAAGKCYTVMAAEYTGVCRNPGLLERARGKAAQKQTPEAAIYLEHVAHLCEKYARGVSMEQRPTFLALAQQIRQEAQQCRQ